MSALSRRWLVFLAVAGCGQPPSGHGLLIVDVSALSPFVAASLHVSVNSAQMTATIDVHDGAPYDFASPHSFALDIPPPELGNVTVTVEARDATNTRIAVPVSGLKRVDPDVQTHLPLVFGHEGCAPFTNPVT